jgi:hypothetical protein
MTEAHALLNVTLRDAGVAGPTNEGEEIGVAGLPCDSEVLRHAAILAS